MMLHIEQSVISHTTEMVAGQLVKVLFQGNTQVQDLAKGIYLIKITTDQVVITEKIIKQ